MTTAALWDVLAKAANLAQLFRDAVWFLAVALSLLRIPQCMRERAELQRCACRLRALMQELPATIAGGCGIGAQHPEMVDLVRRALHDADHLISSYDRNTLWDRLCTGGRTKADQLRDMHSHVDYCCILMQSARAFPPPPSDVATSHQRNVGPPAATVVEA